MIRTFTRLSLACLVMTLSVTAPATSATANFSHRSEQSFLDECGKDYLQKEVSPTAIGYILRGSMLDPEDNFIFSLPGAPDVYYPIPTSSDVVLKDDDFSMLAFRNAISQNQVFIVLQPSAETRPHNGKINIRAGIFAPPPTDFSNAVDMAADPDQPKCMAYTGYYTLKDVEVSRLPLAVQDMISATQLSN